MKASNLFVHFNLLQGYVYVSKLPPSMCFLFLSSLVRLTEDESFLQNQLQWVEEHGDNIATTLHLEPEEIKHVMSENNIPHEETIDAND